MKEQIGEDTKIKPKEMGDKLKKRMEGKQRLKSIIESNNADRCDCGIKIY